MNISVWLTLLLVPFSANAQGFAGLGTVADGFETPQAGYEFRFPEDHGPHNSFRIEWWYLTANLKAEDGTDYGLQWTLFRSALAPETLPGWTDPQLWMGHAAVTTPLAHYASERLARGGVGQAGVTAAPFAAWIDDWRLAGDFDALHMTASGPDFAYDMDLTARGPLVFHGDDGYSVKSAQGQASYYYSQPFFKIEGSISLPEGDVAVTGHAWLDREWSSQPLGDDQNGWDWFSLSFDDGSKLMGFVLRQADDTTYSAASWIDPDGATTTFSNEKFVATPLAFHTSADRRLPVTWQVALAEKGVDVTVEAVNPDAWMATSVPYWEGPVQISGTHSGVGYLEMTGYE